MLFGTAGTADGSLEIAASNRLFGDTGQVTITTGTTNFSTVTFDGSNTQSIEASFNPGGGNAYDFSGANLAQFDVTIDGATVGITLNQAFVDGTALAAEIQAQIVAVTGAGPTVGFSAGQLTFTDVGNAAAVVISDADANSQALGLENSAGTAGGTGASFQVDGNTVNLTTDLTDKAGVLAEIQSQLNTAAPGAYTVEDAGGNDYRIVNNAAGSAATVISNANLGAVASGIVNETGITAANTATTATFDVDGFNVTLDDNYATFDDVAAAIQADLDTGAGAGVYTVSNNAGDISIVLNSGATPVAITNANARATSAGFGNQTGVVTTNASFDVDGTTVTLDQDYASAALLAADLESQLTGYTVTENGGTISITNDTLGSAAVTITGADPGSNAAAAGFGNATGTAGIGAGTVTLSSLTILDGTGKTSTFSGTYDTAQALADDINTNANGVFASISTDGKLQLQSALAFTVGGSDATTIGFTTTEVATSNGSLNDVNVLTTTAADEAIVRIDSALQSVSSLRSDFGAIQNRFESTIANLQGTAENLAASRSRILDADFAAETANLTRAQILQQAGVAILAQANQLPQNVLSLLR
nr:flagellin [Pseudomarimonas arenosa]